MAYILENVNILKSGELSRTSLLVEQWENYTYETFIRQI